MTKSIDARQKGNIFDIAKLAAAFLVILSHTKPFEYSFLLDKATSLITRFSVPVFFTLTGYFLFSGSFTAAKLKKYLLHTV